MNQPQYKPGSTSDVRTRFDTEDVAKLNLSFVKDDLVCMPAVLVPPPTATAKPCATNSPCVPTPTWTPNDG